MSYCFKDSAKTSALYLYTGSPYEVFGSRKDEISDLLLLEKPTKVFGFFAGTPVWSTSSSRYRYFLPGDLKKR